MVRNARTEDASRLAEILIFAKRTAYRDIFKNDLVSFGEMQVLPLAMEYLHTPGLLQDVFVYDDGIVKGMVKLSLGEGTAEIVQLYIDPFFQKAGIGGALLTFAEERIRLVGIGKVVLWVLENNKAARCFYECHGFLVTSGRKLEEGTAEYLLRYEKLL